MKRTGSFYLTIYLQSFFIFSYIRELVRQAGKDVWVGLTDSGIDGTFRFPTDRSYFDPENGETLYKWHQGEPNNDGGNQQCVKAWITLDDGLDDDGLDDAGCDDQFHGLCEIKVFDC